MVQKAEDRSFRRGETMEITKAKGKEGKQEVVRLQCNKGKATKFKRSCFGDEDAVAVSTIFLLACVVYDPSSAA